jgi:hypothetical protein
MKKFACAALAILGVVLGTVTLTPPADAGSVHLFLSSTSNG